MLEKFRANVLKLCYNCSSVSTFLLPLQQQRYYISHLIIKITISLIVIGLKKLLFPTNSLVKLLSDSLLLDTLLSDSLLSDSSISQSHSKLC